MLKCPSPPRHNCVLLKNDAKVGETNSEPAKRERKRP